jgi:hypothetical protein
VTWLLLLLLLQPSAFSLQHSEVPCVYSTQDAPSRATLEAAGITRICAVTEAELASREKLPAPGVTARPGVASPTRSPWIVANGWRFMRQPGTKAVYEVPISKGALAAAEAFAYGADAILKLDAADTAGNLGTLGSMLTFLQSVPPVNLPPVADLAVVDDGSAVTGEVMNLLARRNLLFEVVKSPSARYRINIAIGKAGYPIEEAADPSAFALKIRRQLTDEQRTLRVFGSEVVICRLTGDAGRVRLHLLNYGGREIEGLRIRLKGSYEAGDAYVPGDGRVALVDQVVASGATEFSVPRMATYAVIDLKAVQP